MQMDVSKNRGQNTKMDGFIMENPIKMNDLGVPLFLETPKCLCDVQLVLIDLHVMGSMRSH